MPLPFILAGAAVAAAGYGAKKGYDGYQDKGKADQIIKDAENRYKRAKDMFDLIEEQTNEDLANLGSLQLSIGEDFAKFRKLSESLISKLSKYSEEDFTIDIPKHDLDKIKALEFSTTAYLGKIAGAGVGGAAAAYAVYGGVMALAAASTGTPIAALSGAAAYNATLAAIGGGSLAAGGFGMAGGAAILGGVVAAPIVAIAGWAYASHAEEALSNAQKINREVDESVEKLDAAKSQLRKVSRYVNKIHDETNRIYSVFKKYLSQLVGINDYISRGGNINSIEKEVIEKIDNGYKVAAILTDIITTPIFKMKRDSTGEKEVIKKLLNHEIAVAVPDTMCHHVFEMRRDSTGDNKLPKFETDSNGLRIVNDTSIDDALDTASKDIQQF